MKPELLALFPPKVLFIGFGNILSDKHLYTIECIYGIDPRTEDGLILFAEHDQRDRSLTIVDAKVYKITRATGILADFKDHRVCMIFKEKGLPKQTIIF